MPIVSCKKCKKKFYGKPSHIARGWAKYCSSKCQYAAQYNGKTFRCEICKKSIYRTPRAQNNSKSGRFFCTKSCFMIWKNQNMFFGELHANWKDGANAYRGMIQRAGIAQKCKSCGHSDKRVLLVHHIDHNRKNNVLSNLMWLCRNCHYLIHNGKTV